MASSNRTPRRWDIVVLPFPYSDQFAEKRRPALVVSSDAFNREHGFLWVAMITSAANPPWASDIPLPSGRSGLSAPSVIRAAKIATIEPARVLRVVGHIDAATASSVRKRIAEIVG